MKLTPLLACLLAALPAAALADTHGGDHAYARSGSAPARASQSAPRYQRQAPRYQQQAPRTVYRNVQTMPRYNARPAERQYAYNGGYRSDDRIVYRGYSAQPWGWNGGRAWVASPGFWAGGFWGGLALDLSLNDYVVQPNSPGYDLLGAYGLQQTDCDQPNLVQIYGPDGGEICAYPNDQVGPGAYQVDPSTLTLISE